MSAPQIKPGFKQTEVGVIPQDWGAEDFDRVFRRLNAKANQIVTSQYAKAGALPVIDQGQDAIVGFTDNIEKRFSCPVGGVVIFGDHTRIVKYANFDFVVGADGTQILVGKDGSSTRYLAYCLQFKEVPNTGYNRHFKFLKERIYAVPPTKAEQEAIAEALGDADALIDALEQLLAKKRNLKQGAMQDLLTGKRRLPDFVSSQRIKTEVGELPRDWQVLPIGSIAQVKTGPFGSSLHERDYVDDGIPIITVEHLGERGIIHVNLPLVSDADIKRLKAYSLEKDDIVFSRVGSIDRNALVTAAEAGWLFSGRLLRVRVSLSVVDATYLSYQFHSEPFKQRVRTVAVGQTMASLNAKILRRVSVPVPPHLEQRAIATILSEMDAEIAILEQKLTKARAVKQGMMQELLTGRTRLL